MSYIKEYVILLAEDYCKNVLHADVRDEEAFEKAMLHVTGQDEEGEIK